MSQFKLKMYLEQSSTSRTRPEEKQQVWAMILLEVLQQSLSLK